MASPTTDFYGAASGQSVVGGRAVDQFDSVAIYSEDAGVPYTNSGQTLVVTLHGSSGQNTTTGRQYRAAVSGRLAYDTHTEFAFSTLRDAVPSYLRLRPVDQYGMFPGNFHTRESMWLGFVDMPGQDVKIITERRLDAMMKWAEKNLSLYVNPLKTCLTGGSMGGWGTLTYGIRRPNRFSSLYPDRPRWRYGYSIGNHQVSDYDYGLRNVLIAASPAIEATAGSGTVFALRHDVISYVADINNIIPWIGWCVGRNDGFVQFSDHVDAVVALRASGRGFAFAWNNGNHTTGSILSEITQSYPFGTFEIGKGYPLFTNHSGDQDPAVDLVGGINIGLSFRNVVESSSSWSCEVTSVLGARTVDVKPISKTFTASVSAQTINIPAANTWVPVSFSA